MTKPEYVFAEAFLELSEDILYIQRRLHQAPMLTLTDEQLRNYVLHDINDKLQSQSKQLSNYPSITSLMNDNDNVDHQFNRLINDELNYDRVALVDEHLRLLATMTTEQRFVYDTIITRIISNQSGLFFLNAFGGSGKTFIWRALAAGLRSKGEILLTVASSGVAALLIPGGRTAHSRFCIPITIHEDSTCNINHGSQLAELISRAKLIIWDEAPMMHKYCFEAVDRTFKDILRHRRPGNDKLPFGGKVVVLGGDFRQVLPIIPKGTRQQIVNATINSSYLWRSCEILSLHTNMRLLFGGNEDDLEERRQFADWVLAIGDGKVGVHHDEHSVIDIPIGLQLQHGNDLIADIVNEIYPGYVDVSNYASYYQKRAILAPKNDMVDEINNYMANNIVGEEMIYYSIDTPHSDNLGSDRVDNVHSSEYLNTISSPGLPPHILKLKVGVPVMLLRNIDQNAGLCNGTRLIITKLGKYVVEGQIISGTHVGNKVYIPRLSLWPSDVRIPFKFQRRQFPLSISFAMTINKSQGQSLEIVGVYLRTPVFSHGQLYVAFSRVTRKQGLRVLIQNEETDVGLTTNNVVYHEIFTNLG